MKYKVEYYMGNNYEVIENIEFENDEYIDGCEESVFKGTISDCEAFIRLHEQGYM